MLRDLQNGDGPCVHLSPSIDTHPSEAPKSSTTLTARSPRSGLFFTRLPSEWRFPRRSSTPPCRLLRDSPLVPKLTGEKSVAAIFPGSNYRLNWPYQENRPM